MHLAFTLSMMSKTIYTAEHLNRILNFVGLIVFVYNSIIFKIMQRFYIMNNNNIVFDVQIINFLLFPHENPKP